MSACCRSAMRCFRLGELCQRACRQGRGACTPGASPILAGTADWRRCSARSSGALAIRRQGIYFAMITLALAQMMYFFARAGALHRRRGRHPGGAARPPVRPDQSRRPDQHVFHRPGDLPRRLPADLPHHPFAVRRGAEGDPRERGARDLARLSRPTATSSSPSCCRRPSPGLPAPPRRSCSSSPRSPTWIGRCRARSC